jgi:hypothetical protein
MADLQCDSGGVTHSLQRVCRLLLTDQVAVFPCGGDAQRHVVRQFTVGRKL